MCNSPGKFAPLLFVMMILQQVTICSIISFIYSTHTVDKVARYQRTHESGWRWCWEASRSNRGEEGCVGEPNAVFTFTTTALLKTSRIICSCHNTVSTCF